MNLKNSCRLCRERCSYSSNRTSTLVNGIAMVEILTKIIPISFTDDDKLPERICDKCFETTCSAYNLQKVAMQSDEYYRALIKEQEPPIVKFEIFESIVKSEPEDYDDPASETDVDDDESYQLVETRNDESTKKRERSNNSPNQQNTPSLRKKRKLEENVNESLHRCNFCGKNLSSRKNLLRHRKQQHNPITLPYGCNKCIRRFYNESKLKCHLEKSHESGDEIEVFECDQCGVTGNSKSGIENHLIEDHLKKNSRKIKPKPDFFNCKNCEDKFTDKKDLELHVMSFHEQLFRELNPNEVTINLACCNCEEVQSDTEQLLQHTEVHSSEFQAFKCKFCKHHLTNFSDYIKHTKYHTRPPTHKCLVPRCGRSFVFDEIFLVHIKTHQKYENYKVNCAKCGLKLRSKRELDIHDRVKHKKETLFICPICARSMATNNALDQHIKYVHNKEQSKKFECKICSVKFVSQNKLTRHEAVHSTERPYVCEICKMTFKHSDGLRIHIKRHNGTLLKNNICSQCGFGFNTKHRLEQHMLTHTGLKPHECRFCDRAYASKGDLTKHMQKLHVGDAIYQCEKCPRAFRLVVELREHQREHVSASS